MTTIKQLSITNDLGSLYLLLDDDVAMHKEIDGMEMKGTETDFTLTFLDRMRVQLPGKLRILDGTISYQSEKTDVAEYLAKYFSSQLPAIQSQGTKLAKMLDLERSFMENIPMGWCQQIYAVLRDKSVDVSVGGVLFQNTDEEFDNSVDWVVLKV